MTREEARAAGLVHFRGETCPHGHRTRFVSNNKCVSCCAARNEARTPRARKPRRKLLSANSPKGMAQRVAAKKWKVHPPLPNLRVVEGIEPRNMLLVELERGTCKYPTSTDDHGRHLFCGLAATASSAPYCIDHQKISHAPLTPKITLASSLAA